MSETFGRGQYGMQRLIPFQHASTRDAAKFVGRRGELTYDPCSHTIHVHDGCKPGGCATFTPSLPLCTSIAALPVVDLQCIAPSGQTIPPQLCPAIANLPIVASQCA